MKKIYKSILLQALFSTVALVLGLRLWQTDLHIPLVYSGDGILFSTVTKAVGEGSLFFFKNLGAPFQLDFVDFAFAQYADFFTLQVMQWFGLSGTFAINLYWLCCAVVAGSLATWTFFRFGLSTGLSLFLGYLFSITPWIFIRHIGHLAYHLAFIPTACLVIIFLGLGRTQEFSKKESVFYLLMLVLLGINNTYYAFFAILLMTFSFVYNFAQKRIPTWRPFLYSASAVLGGTLLGLIPGMLYWKEHGKGFATSFKYPAEADIYALKIRHFFQPIPDHPLLPLRKLDHVFAQAQFPLENENMSVRLGLIGSIGLAFLILIMIRLTKPQERVKSLLYFLSSLTIFIFLVATVGGFGSFFNALVSPQIRAYNRLGAFVALFALLSLGLLWSYSENKWVSKIKAGRGQFFLAAALMGFALLDQVPSRFFANGYALAQSQFNEESEFVQRIEGRQPKADMIFQLPFTEYFGDGQELNKMQGYDNGRLFLHSTKIHWSWGSVSARDGGWWKRTAQLEPQKMIQSLLLAGFTGISIDTFAYKEDSLLANLQKEIQSPPIKSVNSRYAFFDLEPLRLKNKGYLESKEAEISRRELLFPLFPIYSAGVHDAETDGVKTWRWCKSKCEVWIKNGLNKSRKARVLININSAAAQSVSLHFAGTEKILTSRVSEMIELDLPANSNTRLYFKDSGKRVFAPSDSRKLYFQLLNFEVTELPF
jgi:phosphoglycerol transferase